MKTETLKNAIVLFKSMGKINADDIKKAHSRYVSRVGFRSQIVKYNQFVATSLFVFFDDDKLLRFCENLKNNLKSGVIKWQTPTQETFKRIEWLAKRENDENAYITLDKRLKYQSLNAFDIFTRLYASGKLSKRQYANAIKWTKGQKAFLSDETRQKVDIFLGHLGKSEFKKRALIREVEFMTISTPQATYNVRLKNKPFKAIENRTTLTEQQKTQKENDLFTLAKTEFKTKLQKDNKFILVVRN